MLYIPKCEVLMAILKRHLGKATVITDYIVKINNSNNKNEKNLISST